MEDIMSWPADLTLSEPCALYCFMACALRCVFVIHTHSYCYMLISQKYLPFGVIIKICPTYDFLSYVAEMGFHKNLIKRIRI